LDTDHIDIMISGLMLRRIVESWKAELPPTRETDRVASLLQTKMRVCSRAKQSPPKTKNKKRVFDE